MARNKSETVTPPERRLKKKVGHYWRRAQSVLICPQCSEDTAHSFELVQLAPVARRLFINRRNKVQVRGYTPEVRYDLAQQVHIKCSSCHALFDIPEGVEVNY